MAEVEDDEVMMDTNLFSGMILFQWPARRPRLKVVPVPPTPVPRLITWWLGQHTV